MNEHLTVDVYDACAKESDKLDAVLSGIENVATITGKLKVSQHVSKLEYPLDILHTQQLGRMVTFPADVNVILTDRNLKDETPLGDMAIVGDSFRGKNLIATVKASYITQSTTKHELAHTFGLPHCDRQDCVMYKNAVYKKTSTPHRRKGFMRALEVALIIPPLELVQHVEQTTEFCDRCQSNLAREAFFLLRQKNGVYIPHERLA